MSEHRTWRDGAAADRLLGTADTMLRRIESLISWGDRIGEARDELNAKRPPLREVLGYADVVDFLVTNHPKAPGATAGAVLRRRQGGEFLVQTFFLGQDGTPLADGHHRTSQGGGDGDNGPPAPLWICRARRLDAELSDAFGDTDLIVFGEAAPSC
ncbi:hypothetical protein [Streptomyces coffeae]|uniref:Uncharacterized protein n=1 Tax=Streptomyces coffeae TaxID=621382 RepID=A0ABS1NFY8_9ACTN|nr:hypothetical protein [Streptomyces coffeae]MBL1098991.1 hypothetical protein [Streptomyces coffeae]